MNFQQFFKLGMDREVPELLEFPSGKVLNVGAGNKLIPGTEAIDYPEWDADSQPLPYEDESIAGIHAYHFLEHVESPVSVLLEFQRVLAPGGVINVVVPYYTSQMQHHDLDHKAAFCEETWRVLFRNPYYNKNRINWQLEVKFNLIAAVKESNLCLMTQLQKTTSSSTSTAC